MVDVGIGRRNIGYYGDGLGELVLLGDVASWTYVVE